jgi:hypothetical protein
LTARKCPTARFAYSELVMDDLSVALAIKRSKIARAKSSSQSYAATNESSDTVKSSLGVNPHY